MGRCARRVLRPQIQWTSARLPTTDVNSDVRMPSVITIAKLRIVPVPNANSTTPAMSVVTFESAIVANAFSKPALIADSGELPARSSSRMRS